MAENYSYFLPVFFVLFSLFTECSAVKASESATQNIGSEDIAIGTPLQIPLTQANRPTQPPEEKASTAPTAAEDTKLDQLTPSSNQAEHEQAEDVTSPITDKPVAETATTTDERDRSPRQAAEAKNVAESPQPGWLGLIVDDSLVTGRLVIVEVNAPGPAHEVGIKPQDVLLAIDGQQLQSADQLAALLSAIPPHKSVRALIGRPDGVTEVTMTAVKRPASTRSPTTVVLAESKSVTDSSSPKAESRFTRPPAVSQSAVDQLNSQPVLQPTTRAASPTVAAVESAPAASPPTRSRFSENHNQWPASLPVSEAAPLAEALPPALPQSPANEPQIRPPVLRGPAVGGRTALGVRTLPIDLATQSRYQLPNASGAYVIGVIESLPASQAGLPPGSVIVAFDNRAVRSPAELNRLVTDSPPGRLVAVQYVLPGGESRRTEVELQALDPAIEKAFVGVPPASQQPTIGRAQTVRRLQTHSPALPADDMTTLAEEVSILRREVLRLRSRLDQLDSNQAPNDRLPGTVTR